MRETRPSGSEGGEAEINRSSLPLSKLHRQRAHRANKTAGGGRFAPGRAPHWPSLLSRRLSFELRFFGRAGQGRGRRLAAGDAWATWSK